MTQVRLEQMFSPGRIAGMVMENRLIRAATWDPSILAGRVLNDEVRAVYRRVAAGGVGAIITGDFSVVPEGAFEGSRVLGPEHPYAQVRIAGFHDLVRIVREENPACRVITQISAEVMGYAPSSIPSPYTRDQAQELSIPQIRYLTSCFAEAIEGLHQAHFDGVELHAAHGGLLSQFLSPYTNRREDEYGGSLEGRTAFLRNIIHAARERVGDFPILVKVNSTDYIPGGVDFDTFPDLARAVAAAGANAIELSGGMWDCLIRPEEELGFPPVPAPESHTWLSSRSEQSYFYPAAAALSLDIPVILTGGNRDAIYLETLLRSGVDFIGLCRPLIREPDLPARWRRGETTRIRCTACNACIYDMWTHVMAGEPWVTRCLLDEEPEKRKAAQNWLNAWVDENKLPGVEPDDFFHR